MVDRPEDFHTITPQMVVSDGAAAIDLYKEAFGAVELVRLPVEGSTKIFHACLRIGDSRIHLADANKEAGLVAPQDASGGSRFLLYIHHEADGILELRWLPAAMTDGAFKATLALFASEAEKIRPAFLLIDATEFRHEFG